MLMFSERFLEEGSFEINYKGKKVIAFFSHEKKGRYKLKFTFVNKNSKYHQAIILHLKMFEGKIYYKDEEIKKSKRSFPQIRIEENWGLKNVELVVELTDGKIGICNGSDPLGDGTIWRSRSGGCAMIPEELGENHYRFYCNDHENDDDFDDLVFDLLIEKEE